MKWETILITLFTLFNTALAAQNNSITELWASYEQTQNEKEQVDLLITISGEYDQIDVYASISTALQAFIKGKKIKYLPGVFDACTNLGIYYDVIGKLDSSFYFYDQALVTGIELDDPYLIAIAKNNLGTYYVFEGNYTLALKYLQEAISDNIDPGYNMEPALTYANIGLIYEAHGNIDKAIEYYQASVSSAIENDREYYWAFIKLSLGYIAYLEKNYEEAIREFKEALAQYKKESIKIKMAETYYYMGLVYEEQNKFEIALQAQQHALALYQEQNSILDIPSMYTTIANIYRKAGDNVRALDYYEQAIVLAKEVNSPTDLVDVYEELAKSYAEGQNYELAYKYQLLFQNLKDTLYKRETGERIDQMETTYTLKVQIAENAKLLAEQAKKEVLLQQRTILAVGTSLIALLVAIIAYFYYRANRQKRIHNQNLEKEVAVRTAELKDANARLLESNEELERFTYIASHDLKEPLRNITSFINLIQRKLKDFQDETLHEYMRFVTSNTKQMYFLLNDILTFSRIAESGNNKFETIDLNLLIEEIKNSLNTMLHEKNGRIQIKNLPIIIGPKVQLFLLFKNLIENGLKYNQSSEATVEIDSIKVNSFYQFSIKDNGIGIAPKYHEQIFEMFKRLNNRHSYMGSGIGLATCKKIISKYGGKIWLESEEGKGSCFFFTFPGKLPDVQNTSKSFTEFQTS